MLNKFQDKAQKIIALAESIAFDLSQSNVATEHLLLSFLKIKDNKLRSLLEKEGITYDLIRDEVIELFGKKPNKPFYMEYTVSFKKVLENAISFAKKKNEDKVSADILAVALLESNDSVSIAVIIVAGVITALTSVGAAISKQQEYNSYLQSARANAENQVPYTACQKYRQAFAVKCEDEDVYKYINQAILAHPELYFSKLVILGEGDSEEIVIPQKRRCAPRFVHGKYPHGSGFSGA